MLAHVDNHDGLVDVHLQLCCRRTEEAQQAFTSPKYVLLLYFFNCFCMFCFYILFVLMFYFVTGVGALPYR